MPKQSHTQIAVPVEAGEHAGVHVRRWYMLAVILLPTLLLTLNNYMVQVALPLMQSSLGASFSEAQFVVAGYSLGLALALIVAGKLGDMYGRVRMLFIGVGLFTGMAALGGFTSNPTALIAIRIVQGLGAAIIQPQVLSTMQVSFLPREKPLVLGIYGSLIGIGFAFGLILGGVLVQWNLFELGWRSVFLFHVPFGLLTLLFLPLLQETRGVGKATGIDWLGSGLLMVGLFLLIFPLTEGQKEGWPLWTWGSLLMGILMLLGFWAVEKRKSRTNANPLIDVRIFQLRSFQVGMLGVLVTYLSMFTFFFILSYYVQYGLHYTVQTTSLVYLPIGIGFFLASLVSSRLVKRWGMVVLKMGALIMGLCSFLLIGSLSVDAVHLLHVQNVLILLVYGFGLGMVTTPLAHVVLSQVPQAQAGIGSGLLTTCMYVANSLGVALIGILFSASLGHSLAEAMLWDYVRAFFTSLSASGALAFAAFVCLSYLPNASRGRSKTRLISK